MASSKNNYVVNYFTLEISNIGDHKSLGDSNSTKFGQYDPETPTIFEINANDIIFDDNVMIDMKQQVESASSSNNNNHNTNGKINIIEDITISDIPTQEQHIQDMNNFELSENNDETSGGDDDDDDDFQDLTNLNWLTELKNITNLPPTTCNDTEKPCDPPSQRFDKFINQVQKIKETYEKRKEIYRTSSSEKPPFNYAQIIGELLHC